MRYRITTPRVLLSGSTPPLERLRRLLSRCNANLTLAHVARPTAAPQTCQVVLFPLVRVV